MYQSGSQLQGLYSSETLAQFSSLEVGSSGWLSFSGCYLVVGSGDLSSIRFIPSLIAGNFLCGVSKGLFMAKVPAKSVLKALGDSHLRAIGLVAAQWAELEMSVVWVLSRIADISLSKAVILAGAQNAVAWIDMIKKISYGIQQEGQPKIKTAIDPISKEIADLLKLRNDIVHTSWNQPSSTAGLLDIEGKPNTRPRAALRAEGIGIPKRGSKVFSRTSLNTREMLKIATRIQEVEQTLFLWWNQRQKTNRLTELLLARPANSKPVKNLGFGDLKLGASSLSSTKTSRSKK